VKGREEGVKGREEGVKGREEGGKGREEGGKEGRREGGGKKGRREGERRAYHLIMVVQSCSTITSVIYIEFFSNLFHLEIFILLHCCP
jgi:hypothetical protein